ncbi:MAG: hypothetical protein M3470_09160 [Chloroflexota bacterium]|nr:hypothetical protein [Chloroflexota bacterium]
MEPSEIKGWIAGRVSEDWYEGSPDVLVDRDEIVVVGNLPDIAEQDGVDLGAARAGRVKQHREATREARVRIAQEAERRFGRHISFCFIFWENSEIFTHLSIPVMTRLRINERQLLDSLVDAGVARSRSHALAWCVRLVADHQGDWVRDLREAMERVEQVRGQGPKLN